MSDRTAIPRVVWIITALGFSLMVLYATLFPTYRAPDEPEHVDLAVYMSREFSYPAYDGLSLSEQTTESKSVARFGYRELVSDDIAARGDRPSFDDLGSDQASEIPNRMPQHPPLYYALIGGLLRIATFVGAGALPFDATVWLLRTFTAVLVSAVPALAYLTAVRLTNSRTAGIAAAIVPLAIPQFTHIGSSVNNDGLLILLSAGLTLLVARVLRGDESGRAAFLIGLVAGLALITKAFALVFPFWIVLLYVMIWRRGMRWQIAATRIGQVAAAAFVAGGWWWFRNLAEFGRLQSSLPAYNDSVDGFVTRPLWWIGRFAVWITESFWGWMGWFEAKLPVLVIAAATLIIVVTLATAIVDWQGRNPITRGEVLYLLSPTVLIGAIVIQRAYAVYADTGVTRGIQGRYFFPLIVALSAVLAATWIGVAGRRSRFVPVVVLGGAAVMQTSAVFVIVTTYYGSDGDAFSESLGSWLAWSPLPPWVTIPVLVTVIVLFPVAADAVRRNEGIVDPVS